MPCAGGIVALISDGTVRRSTAACHEKRIAALDGIVADSEASDTEPGDTDNDIEPEETEEVDVLGIQLTREDQPSGRGPLGTGVALLAILALLPTAGAALWSRQS